MNISNEVKQSAVDYTLKSVRYICEEIGPRESGMQNERKAQEWMKKQLLDEGWADRAEIEDFTVSRHALVGFTKIVSPLMVVAAVLQLLFLINDTAGLIGKILSLAIAVFTLITFVLEFLMYVPFIDPILPKSTSGNVYASKAPTGEVKRRIVFSGHCDSAYEWMLLEIKPVLMVLVIAVSAVGLLYSLIIYVLTLFLAIPLWCNAVALCFVPAYVALFWMCTFKLVVPGANDNLTGAVGSMAVLKCLKESGIELENTEVAVVLTGSEEAGLRGAKAWAKKHGEEIKNGNVETVFIGLETLRDYDDAAIYVRDLSGTVKHSDKAVALLDKASAAVGHPLPHASVFFGASDAAAITKAGLDATCLAAMDPTPAAYYHNHRDNPDNMSPETIRLGLDVALEAVRIFDKNI